MEIVASSILIGFFFSIIITIVEKFRTEQLGGVRIPFVGWMPLQAGIVIYAYLTLFLFLSFIAMNIFALEKVASKESQSVKKIHRWSISVLILASMTGIITLMLFSALVIPQEFVNPLLEALSGLHFLILLIIMIFAIAKILSYIKRRFQ